MHRIIAVIHRNSRGRLVFEIVGLASGTTFVGTIEEGWNSHQTAVQHDKRQTTKALHQGTCHEPGISSLGHSNFWIFQHDFGMFQGDDSSLWFGHCAKFAIHYPVTKLVNKFDQQIWPGRETRLKPKMCRVTGRPDPTMAAWQHLYYGWDKCFWTFFAHAHVHCTCV